MEKFKTFVSLVILIVVCGVLYSSLLDRTPVHLNQDEVGFALNAYSIAKTGLDDNGRPWPLYFWHLGVMWATPFIVYLTAAFLKFFPLSEVVIRIPSVIIGTLNVVLIWFVSLKVFNSQKYAFLAGLLLVATPLHFVQSRILLDNHFILPFVTGWLISLWLFIQTNKGGYLVVGTFLLGLGVHSYHAAKIMMPVFLLLAFWCAREELKQNKKLLAVATGAFVLPLIPLAVWLQQYPDTLVDQVKYTGIYDTKLGVLTGVGTLLTPKSLVYHLDVYANYFNPRFLFLRGDQSLIHSTHRAGVFLLPLIVFVPVGIWQMFKSDRFGRLLTFGFFVSPIAAVIAGDHFRISRALVILPFAMLLAVCGIKRLFESKRWRVASLLLVIAVPFQFLYFLYDYLTDYRIRSYSWMNNNVPGALESVIREERQKPLSGIYFDKTIDFLPSYWRFYLIKHGELDLQTKTNYFDPKFTDAEELPVNSLIFYSHHNVDGQKQILGPFRKLSPVFEPDGTQRFYLYRN